MVKGSFGCGSIVADNWHNIDKENFGQEYVGSTELFEDNYFDIIVAHCSLQTNEWHEIGNVLKELYRILKHDGILRISLPDIETGFDNYKNKKIDWFPNGEKDLDVRFSAWLTWYSSTKTLLTPHALIMKLGEAGFRCASRTEFKHSVYSDSEITELDSRQFETFIIEAMK